jgi:hypothetical protein
MRGRVSLDLHFFVIINRRFIDAPKNKKMKTNFVALLLNDQW